MSGGKLSWEQFNAVNEDRRTAFEDLCRQLFKYTYFDRKTCFNANTNNPGIEIEPLYSEITIILTNTHKFNASKRAHPPKAQTPPKDRL